MSFITDAEKTVLNLNQKNIHPAILVGVLILLVVVLFFVFQNLWNVVNAEDDLQITSTEETADESQNQTQEDSSFVCVHILGAVANPGMYEFASGARVNDAVNAAGGLTENAEMKSINLARKLEDGEQLYVMTTEEYEASQSGSQSASASSGTSTSSSTNDSTTVTSSSSSGLININTATQAQLETLPGIGSATAQKIIADRQTNGAFSSPSDITRVSGIGDKRYEAIKDLITV